MILRILLTIILWVLIVVFALIFLLLILPINIELYSNGEKFDFKIKIWFLRIDTLGKWFSKKKNKNQKNDSKKQKSGKGLKDIQNSAQYVKAFVSTSGKIIRMVFKSIVFKNFNLKIVVGSEEASKTATTYGMICTAVYPAASAFMAFCEPKNYDISVVPDFVSDKIKVFLDLRIRTRLVSFLIIAIKAFRIVNSKLK